jgi:hypothetical protein
MSENEKYDFRFPHIFQLLARMEDGRTSLCDGNL